MYKSFAIAFFLAFSFGCATQSTKEIQTDSKADEEALLTKKDESTEKVKCTSERRTGSHMRTKLCMTDRDRQTVRENSLQELEKVRRGRPLPIK